VVTAITLASELLAQAPLIHRFQATRLIALCRTAGSPGKVSRPLVREAPEGLAEEH
jgi:hypothetical protein